MRNAFLEALYENAKVDPSLFLIVGDLGYSVVEKFARQFPDRFLNAGVAEQNMTGVAAGLALSGYKVFTYSIANFPTLRCFEQIRNDICYHHLDITVVAVGAGVAYGAAGYSHHAVQDLACMRSLPGLTILTPCDPEDAVRVTRWAVSHPGPKYLRLGKGGEAPCLPESLRSDDAPVVQLRPGRDQAVFLFGPQASLVSSWAERHAAAVFAVSRWSGDRAFMTSFARLADDFARIIVVEEHFQPGGCGSYVLEAMAAAGLDTRKVTSFALEASVMESIGSNAFLKKMGGFSEEAFERRAADGQGKVPSRKGMT